MVIQKTESFVYNKMRQQKPHWLKTEIPSGYNYFRLKAELEKRGLYTICQSAKCPNIAHCWQKMHATFLILGDTCTRDCHFCSVRHGRPQPPDEKEAGNIIEMIEILNLRYVVITSVTRDDLEDGGSSHFGFIIKQVRNRFPDLRIEVLIPDFGGNRQSLSVIFQSAPDIINHNLETIHRLYPRVNRNPAGYSISLKVLKESSSKGFLTKSGIMVGMGETLKELKNLFEELLKAGVKFLTIGQYLQPTKKQLGVERYYTPAEFQKLKQTALAFGFAQVESGPFVRSSYGAESMYQNYQWPMERVIN